jgi:hypothetical protein
MSRHCSKASSSASASGFDVIQQLQASGSGVFARVIKGRASWRGTT